MVLHARVISGSGGGPDKTILRTPRYVDTARYRVAAAYIHPEGDAGILTLREHARAFGCDLWEVAESGAVDVRTLRSLLQLCRKLRVDIWHGHDYKSNLFGLLLRRVHPMRLVTTLHGWTKESARTRLYYHVDNLCLPRYEQVMAVSPLLMDHCRALGVTDEKLTYIPNGIDADDFQPSPGRAAARDALNVDGRAFVLGVVGRLSKEKGVDRAVQTLANLLPKYPHLSLHLIGDGPEKAALQKLASDLGVASRVRFCGWQSDARPHYRAMDALLLPSHTEGLPNVVLEAMAMGVPVAVTAVGGVPELLDNGRCGVLLNQDQASWANLVAPLIVSADRRAELARRGRERIEIHYSFRHRVERELAVYDRLLQPAQTRRRAAA